nr:type II toxin-antitoxin system VapC family toxin [Niveispirillum sp. BGYR6]
MRPLFRRMTLSGAHAPILLRYEVTNVLVNAQRRSRIGAAYRQGAVADLEIMPIRYSVPLQSTSMARIAELAVTHGLTGYDAAYLALALDLGLPLASIDKQLLQVATLLGVPTL